MLRSRILPVFAWLLLATASVAAQEMHMTPRSIPAFDQLKTLVGHWEGATSDGKKVSVVYELISNGSVLMERLSPGNEPDMITMYSLDGGHIAVTHYCSAGNQPTMQTAPFPAANGKYEFTFLRLAGAGSPDEGHMTALTVFLPDKNHLVQTWTFTENGKSASENFTYTRKT